MKKFVVFFSLFIFFSLGIIAQTRYVAKTTKTILGKLGISSKEISDEWQIFSVVDSSSIANLRKAGVYVELDREAKINSVPNDELFTMQWGLTGNNNLWNGNFNDAWTITEGSKEIKVGILDTGSPLKNGVWTHPDLDSNRFTNPLSFISSGDSDETVTDYSGHSTHVIGIISGTKNNKIGIAGIDQKCEITTYKVFSKYGSGWYSDIAEAIYRATQNGCKILSMSFGGIFYSRILEDAIYFAQEHGVVCVIAAGNDGSEIAEYPAFFGRFSTHENYRNGFPNIISVGAINSYGSVSKYSNNGWFIDIYAPGGSGAYPRANTENVLSTFPNYSCILGKADSNWYYDENDSLIVTNRIPEQKTYGYLAGTSMATPFITGTVSLMLAANPKLPSKEIRKMLIETAENITTVDGNIQILNPGAAVKMAKDGNGGILASTNNKNSKITNFSLSQNYPNPFNPSTTISYQLPTSGFVTLKVYDIIGKEVTTLVNEEKPAGNYTASFNASNLASGMYIYTIKSGNFNQTKKMILMK